MRKEVGFENGAQESWFHIKLVVSLDFFGIEDEGHGRSRSARKLVLKMVRRNLGFTSSLNSFSRQCTLLGGCMSYVCKVQYVTCTCTATIHVQTGDS